MKLLRCAEVKEGQENYESTLDIMFRTLEEREPEHMAVRSYKIFKQAGAKTAQSILISCSVRLQVFNMSAITRLTGTDNIDLASIGDEKTALFCITPVVDTTFNFLVALMYTQLFDALYFHAETECKGKRLPIHVRFMLDEFANIGTIPEFNQKVSTMRKYEISVTIILQALSQIKAMYKDDWEVLVGNCDEQIFLGGSDATTLEYISKKLGKETIRAQNSSRSFGRQGSSSLSYNKTGRELMTPDELAQMDNENCIIFIRGEKPFFSKKYDLERHHNYKLTGDASDEYLYNVKEVFKTTSLEKIRDINTSVNEKLRKKAEKTDTSHAERELRKVREPIRQTSVKGRACYSPNSIADTVKAVTGKDISENATEKEINELLGDELHPSNGYVPKGYDEYDDSSEVKE